MTRLFSTHPLLTRSTSDAFASPKVHVINADAFVWLDAQRRHVRLRRRGLSRTRTTTASASCTRRRSTACSRGTSRRGGLVRRAEHVAAVRAASRTGASSRRCKSAGLNTYPYHVYVPSFGEWGFVLGARDGAYTPPTDAAGRPALSDAGGGQRSRSSSRATWQPVAVEREPAERPDARALLRAKSSTRSTGERREACGRFSARVGGAVRRVCVPLVAPALVGLTRKSPRRSPADSSTTAAPSGHRLARRHARPRARGPETRVPVVIVGGGMAGLSAAWELAVAACAISSFSSSSARPAATRAGARTRSRRIRGRRTTCRCPAPSATLVRELFDELGVLRDGGWEERYLCFAPQERLFAHGEWHDGHRAGASRSRRGPRRRSAASTS